MWHFFPLNLFITLAALGLSSLPHVGSLWSRRAGLLQLPGMSVSLMAFLVAENRLKVHSAFTGCRTWASGSAALQHVGSLPTRDRTCVPHTGRQILNHGPWGKSRDQLHFFLPFTSSLLGPAAVSWTWFFQCLPLSHFPQDHLIDFSELKQP